MTDPANARNWCIRKKMGGYRDGDCNLKFHGFILYLAFQLNPVLHTRFSTGQCTRSTGSCNQVWDTNEFYCPPFDFEYISDCSHHRCRCYFTLSSTSTPLILLQLYRKCMVELGWASSSSIILYYTIFLGPPYWQSRAGSFQSGGSVSCACAFKF